MVIDLVGEVEMEDKADARGETLEPEGTVVPEATEPKSIESMVGEPKATKPEAMEPKAAEPEEVELKEIECRETDPKGTPSVGIEPKATKPKETEPKGKPSVGAEPKAIELKAQRSLPRSGKSVLKRGHQVLSQEEEGGSEESRESPIASEAEEGKVDHVADEEALPEKDHKAVESEPSTMVTPGMEKVAAGVQVLRKLDGKVKVLGGA